MAKEEKKPKAEEIASPEKEKRDVSSSEETKKLQEKPAPRKTSPNLLHAALLLHSAGKEVNEANLKKVIDAAGVKADEAQVKALVSALEGVDIQEAISQAVAAPAAPAAEKPAEEKKEEKKEEEEEKKAEEAVEGISSLFG